MKRPKHYKKSGNQFMKEWKNKILKDGFQSFKESEPIKPTSKITKLLKINAKAREEDERMREQIISSLRQII